MQKSWYIIINPTSGNAAAKKKWKKIVTYLDFYKISYFATFTQYKHHETELVNNALQTLLPRIVNLSGVPIVYVHSRVLSSSYGIDAGKGLNNLVVAVPLNEAPFGSYATLLPKDLAVSEIVYDSPRNITSLDIRLRDSQGKILDIGNLHMTLIVKLYFS